MQKAPLSNSPCSALYFLPLEPLFLFAVKQDGIAEEERMSRCRGMLKSAQEIKEIHERTKREGERVAIGSPEIGVSQAVVEESNWEHKWRKNKRSTNKKKKIVVGRRKQKKKEQN